MNVATSIPPGLTITWAVTCCAAEPGLDGLLLFDLPPAALSGVASALIQALTLVDPALNFAWEELSILEQLLPAIPGFDDYRRAIQQITSESNLTLIQIVEDLAYVFSDGRANMWSVNDLRSRSSAFTNRLITTRDEFILRNQDLILESLQADAQPACA